MPSSRPASFYELKLSKIKSCTCLFVWLRVTWGELGLSSDCCSCVKVFFVRIVGEFAIDGVLGFEVTRLKLDRVWIPIGFFCCLLKVEPFGSGDWSSLNFRFWMFTACAVKAESETIEDWERLEAAWRNGELVE